MFRELLTLPQFSSHHTHNLYSHDELKFPNINQLIKSKIDNNNQIIKWIDWVEYHEEIRLWEMRVAVVEEYRVEKIRFVTVIHQVQKFQGDEEDMRNFREAYKQNVIKISEQPIHADAGCVYFLLTIAWCPLKLHKSHTYISSKKDEIKKTLKLKQKLTNLIYLLSQIIYIHEDIQLQFLNLISDQNRNCYGYKNVLKVYTVGRRESRKKRYGVVSTTAETRFAGSQLENGHDDKGNLLSNTKGNPLHLSPHHHIVKSSFLKSKKSAQSSKQNHNLHVIKQRLFSRVVGGMIFFDDPIQGIVKDVKQMKSCSQSLAFSSIKSLSDVLRKNKELPFVREFHQLNSSNITEEKVDSILGNYMNAIELQFTGLTPTTNQQLSESLKTFYDVSIQQFYTEIEENSVPSQIQEEWQQKLITKINSIQRDLIELVGRGKKQSIERRLSLYEDENYLSEMYTTGTKFDNFIGKGTIQDIEMGYQLYHNSLKDRLNSIFSQLIEQAPQTTQTRHHHDSTKNRQPFTIKRNQFNLNIDQRIEILLSQKRNIEQSLHFEQSMQENLMDYLRGGQGRGRVEKMEKIQEEVDNQK